MELIEILSKLKHLDHTRKKYHVDHLGEYAHLVFNRENMPEWLQAIEAILGPAIKTEEQRVSEEIVRLTEDFGELFDHQTLYYRKIDDQRVMAMLWPWKRGDAVTLKIMILKGEDPCGSLSEA